jgi:hypothetical protein
VSRMLFRLERRVKIQIQRLRRNTGDKALAMRCQIVLLTAVENDLVVLYKVATAKG